VDCLLPTADYLVPALSGYNIGNNIFVFYVKPVPHLRGYFKRIIFTFYLQLVALSIPF